MTVRAGMESSISHRARRPCGAVEGLEKRLLTIRSGATIQFSTMLKPIWIHSCLERNAR